MTDNTLFSTCQHGFHQHRSCITQLLEVMEDLTKMVDKKLPIDVIYLDCSKPFDSVPHVRLLSKFKLLWFCREGAYMDREIFDRERAES